MTGKPDDEVLGDYPGGDQSMGQLMPQLTPEVSTLFSPAPKFVKTRCPLEGSRKARTESSLASLMGLANPRIES